MTRRSIDPLRSRTVVSDARGRSNRSGADFKKWGRGPFDRAIRFVACVDARERSIDARERSMDETRNGRANDGRLRVARARGADCGRVDGASVAMMR
jgi:hypothetical protein